MQDIKKKQKFPVQAVVTASSDQAGTGIPSISHEQVLTFLYYSNANRFRQVFCVTALVYYGGLGDSLIMGLQTICESAKSVNVLHII